MRSRTLLHSYQLEAAEYIKTKKTVSLWMGLGLGKTISTLTAITDLYDGMMINRVLVIAPLRVANSVWAQEAHQWEHTAHLSFAIATGTEKNRLTALHHHADVTVINRENVEWLVNILWKQWSFDMIVIDESPSFKSSATKRFKALRKVAPASPYRVLLTGTPSPNGLMDLWSQQYLVDFGYSLGRSVTEYRRRFFEKDYSGFKWVAREGSDKIIKDAIRDTVLSMETKDYIDMPERIDVVVQVTLPPGVMQNYRVFEHELLIEIEGETLQASNAAVLTGKLLQWANGAVYKDEYGRYAEVHNAKLEALSELLEDNPNENVIVAYYFQSDLQRLKARFPDAVALDKDPKTIERWNAGEIKMLLIHPCSAGHGLNLQHGGSVIIWFGLTWSLEYYQQTIGRVHRQGQKNSTRIVHIVAKDTMDERVLQVLQGKASLQQALIESMKKLDIGCETV